MSKYADFLNRYAATSERLHRIGIHPYGYGPGFLCTIDGDASHRGVDIPEDVAKIICSLVMQISPETKSNIEMIDAYIKRVSEYAAKQKKAAIEAEKKP